MFSRHGRHLVGTDEIFTFAVRSELAQLSRLDSGTQKLNLTYYGNY